MRCGSCLRAIGAALVFAALALLSGVSYAQAPATGAFLSYNAYGGATPLPLYFNINGVNYQFPFTTGGVVGPSSTTIGHCAIWENTTGTLLGDQASCGGGGGGGFPFNIGTTVVPGTTAVGTSGNPLTGVYLSNPTITNLNSGTCASAIGLNVSGTLVTFSCGGGGGGGGTVTSVGTSAPLAGGPITTTGTISLSGPSNLTTFAAGAIPKGAGTSPFTASSISDAGSGVTIGAASAQGAGTLDIPTGYYLNGSLAATAVNGSSCAIGGSCTATASAGTLTGSTLNSSVIASSLTSVGTLTGGATGSGFTVNIGASAVIGNLTAANLGLANGNVYYGNGANQAVATPLTTLLASPPGPIGTAAPVAVGVTQATSPQISLVESGGNVAVNASQSQTFGWQITGNDTLQNPTGLVSGNPQILDFRVQQDATGGHSLSFGGNYVGSVTIATSPNAVTTFAAYCWTPSECDLSGGVLSGSGTLTLTDGTHSVSSVTQITVTGGTVGGTTPNATLTITGGGGGSGTVNSGTSGQLAYYATTGMAVSGETTLTAGQFPAMTGDVTNSAGSLATTVGKIGGNTVSLGGSFTTTGGALTLTETSTTNVTLPTSGTLLNNTLSSGDIFLGNGSNVATQTAIGGACTTSNLGTFTCFGSSGSTLSLSGIASIPPNTVLGNFTGSTASPTATAVTGCSATNDAITYTTNTGFTCNSSITANTVPAANLTGSTLASGVTASSLTSLGTLTSLTVSGGITATGLSSGTCTSLIALNSSNQAVTESCGTIFNATLSPGLSNSASTFNGLSTLQTLATGNTLYPQFGIVSKSSAYNLNADCNSGANLCDTARLVLANGSGSVAITAPNPIGTLASYQIGDQSGHGFTVPTAGGTATFGPCVTGSPTTLTVPANYAVQLWDQGSGANSYYCIFTPTQAAGGISGLIAGQVAIAGGTNSISSSIPVGNSGNSTILETNGGGTIPVSVLASSATNVNGVGCSLGGSCTVPAAAGTLTGTTLASGITASSLTSLGTLTSLTVSGTSTFSGSVVGNNQTFSGASNIDNTIVCGATYDFSSVSNANLTVNSSFPVGCNIAVEAINTGLATVVAGTGTVDSACATVRTRATWSTIWIHGQAAGVAVVSGDCG